ncbi:MAG: hypothetical protein JWP76_1134, partial [Dactylosporangium sp.]|nr:hypothetical protein [Dactylosporangium sp.]
APGKVCWLDGVWLMPHTLVHWSRDSVMATGATVVSALPCQIATRGQGPVQPMGFQYRVTEV